MRALRLTRTSLPRPGSVNVFFAFLYAICAICSRIAAACFLVMPFFSAISAALCDFESAFAILSLANFVGCYRMSCDFGGYSKPSLQLVQGEISTFFAENGGFLVVLDDAIKTLLCVEARIRNAHRVILRAHEFREGQPIRGGKALGVLDGVRFANRRSPRNEYLIGDEGKGGHKKSCTRAE